MIDRRQFIDWMARGAAAATVAGSPKFLQALAPESFRPNPAGGVSRKGKKWIIPTDDPDRFGLKVMEFNPIPAPNPATWELELGGMVNQPVKLKVGDLKRFPAVKQSSRLKCVQCWSGRILWEGFRCSDLLGLARPKPEATWIRVDCADSYFDYVSMEDLLHPRTLFAVGMNGEPLTPEHGAPLRLVIPFKYGYKSSKLLTKITFTDHGGQGLVADSWPYYSQSGEIEPGYDHPFDFPGETRKIEGGEILDY